ncbi:unnamed protein product [Lactuca virosa]|uniref:C2H2-type domain-containing protein n=1 Tax=Lactuca virosa TaxID=75947 RepID=A0AAU9LYJ8_9ASTR|nr:unnamed protein product [Lactuca virosa]
MEFRFGGFDQLYRTPNFSYRSPEEGLLTGRSFGGGGGRSESFRDIEKKIIREEILAEEAERRRVLTAEVRRELMMERQMMAMQSSLGYSSSLMLEPPHSHHNWVHPAALHGESRALEVVSSQRAPQSPEVTDITTSPPKVSEKPTIDLGKHFGPPLSGAKRKPPSAAGGSTELCYSSRKIGSELNCALCEVTATSERGFQEHLAGKKHKAKAAGLRTCHTGKTKNCVMESSLRLCKLGASDKKVVTKRKKHMKNRKRRRKSTGKTC